MVINPELWPSSTTNPDHCLPFSSPPFSTNQGTFSLIIETWKEELGEQIGGECFQSWDCSVVWQLQGAGAQHEVQESDMGLSVGWGIHRIVGPVMSSQLLESGAGC